MKKIIYYLSTCSTCKKIISQIDNIDQFQLIDLKNRPIKEAELSDLKTLAQCNYEDLFNKRAQKYKSVKDTVQSDDQFKKLILEEYTFLKRPIIIYDGKAYIGNSKTIVLEALEVINN